MKKELFIKADEVAEILGISRQLAYKLIHSLNDELAKKGFITVAGRVSRKYFSERVYGVETMSK